MTRSPIQFVVMAAALIIGCSSKPTTKPAATLPPEAIEKNNQGVGLMGQLQGRPIADAHKVFAELVEQYPKHDGFKVNLAIATLNRQQPGDESAALEILKGVVERDPKNLVAHYCCGLLLYHGGNLAEARQHFQTVADADPADGFAAYYCGICISSLGDNDEAALQWFNKAIAADRDLVSAYYGAQQVSRRLKRPDEAKKLLQEFNERKDSPFAKTAELKYSRMGPKAEALRIDDATATEIPTAPAGPQFAEPQSLVAADGTPSWEPVKADQSRSITACDIDGDGRIDLFITGAVRAEGGVRNAVLLQQGDGGFKVVLDHPLAKVSNVNAVLWGDYDNDGLTDAYCCRNGPNLLFRQAKPNQWEDVTATTKTGGGNFNTVDGLFADADHDGDLDLLLIRSNGPTELLNNDRNGGFRPIAKQAQITGDGRPAVGVVVADLDGDRDVDVIVLHDKPPHDVFFNDRVWKYHAAEGFDKFRSTNLQAAVAGVDDATARPIIHTLGPDGLGVWRRDASGNWEQETTKFEKSGANRPHLALADMTGIGRLMSLASPESALRLPTDSSASESPTGYAVWTVVNLGTKGGPSVVGILPSGEPKIHLPGLGRFEFANLTFNGKINRGEEMFTNASGIGVRAAVRAGSNWIVRHHLRATSGPGQSLQPLAFGLRGKKQIDYVSLDWPDGVFQSELEIAAGKLKQIVEIQRKPTSCPILFVWNGQRFEFVTDLLGVGGLGFFVQPGQYAPVRPWENLMLPAGLLAPKDGRYQLKLTEPMEEITYLDWAALQAYDLPPGWQMVLDERMGTGEPEPTGKPRFYRSEILPIRATNDRGEDVLHDVLTKDGKAADVGPHDGRFIGMLAREHALVLTFAKPIDQGPGKPMLIADGWIEYPFSQSVFAAWQAGLTYQPPTIEARSKEGAWKTVLKEFGYPAGMPRLMSVPLDRLPPGTTELRIRTNQEIYWDRLAIAYAEDCPQARMSSPPLRSAHVAHVGFPEWTKLPQRRATLNYDHRSPFDDTRNLEGLYTALGPAEVLVRAADDALAIIGPGDEIHLEFDAVAETAPKDWTRIFVLQTVGWCKDMDLYTQHGETVEPLPTRAPRSPAADRLHEQYNTRFRFGR